MPLSWRLYVAGMMNLQRARAAEQLRAYDCAVMAQANKESRADWVHRMKTIAGEE